MTFFFCLAVVVVMAKGAMKNNDAENVEPRQLKEDDGYVEPEIEKAFRECLKRRNLHGIADYKKHLSDLVVCRPKKNQNPGYRVCNDGRLEPMTLPPDAGAICYPKITTDKYY